MALNLLDKPDKTKSKVSIDKTKSKVSIEYAIQLALTLLAMYIVNKIGIDIWRAVKGH